MQDMARHTEGPTAKDATISLRLTQEELAELNKARGSASRSQYLRLLIRQDSAQREK